MTRAATILLLVLLAGCSTRPRDFKPSIAVAPVNQDVQMRDFAVCKMMVDRGLRGNFSKQAAALAPGAAGLGVATAASAAALNATLASVTLNAAVSTITFGTVSTPITTTGAAALSTTVLPIIGAAASIAIAASAKKGNEKKVKSALGTCMKEYGHDVTNWQVDRAKMSELPAELPRDPARVD